MPLRRVAISAVLVVITVGCSGTGKVALPCTRPSAASISLHPVVGALGNPLGTPVVIRGNVVAGSKLPGKLFDGSYLLRVTEVDGRPLTPAPLLKFDVWSDLKLAKDEFSLYELKTGSYTSRVDSAQIRELE